MPLKNSPAAILKAIRTKLKHYSTEWTPEHFLDTGFPELNAVLGHRDKGIPYGKMVEIAGLQSHGKTALVLDLATLAQVDGAQVVWLDLENSWEDEWAAKRGLDPTKIFVLNPYVGKFRKKKKKGDDSINEDSGSTKLELRLSTAQELCEEVEAVLMDLHEKDPDTKIFLGVDSVTAFLTEEEAAAGLTDQNMRTAMSLPIFLGKLLRRWVGLAQSYNVLMFFINQIRLAPIAFGNPERTTGGSALKFYCHVRASMRRAKKGGKMLRQGHQIGIKGTLTNTKNKAGGVEGDKCGYKIYFGKPSKFLAASEVEG